MAVYKPSFADAEVFEYVHEGFVRGDCASGYVSQILQDLFEVFGYEVAGQVG
ncbi:MAG: hypothetical protein GX899_01525, partial [Rikenellaceae bacterium]|nr:hypothetical protein [Rikenellaceae bacterium]